MKLEITSFADGAAIPGEFAFAVPADEGQVALSSNRNPHLKWSDAPEGTKSFAVICHDPDVPSVGDDVNQEGKTVSQELPRVDFYHWVLVDIPASVHEIAAGSVSEGVTARGKEPGKSDLGVTGINDYTGWFAGDEDMKGDYGGYDGPCPPWNDALIHRYVFTGFALDTETLDLSGSFTGLEAFQAMEDHILDQAAWTGTYTLNKQLISAES
jgi:hypothetical protein